MTSEEIAKREPAAIMEGETWYGLSVCACWLQEIAFQLAVMNEQKVLDLQRQSEMLNGGR